MIKNYFKLSVRNIQRQKSYSFINIFGLALGIACAILILLWVQDEVSYDRFHEHKENIFRVTFLSEESAGVGTPAPMAPTLVEELPEVLDATRVRQFSRVVLKYKDRAFYEGRIFSVDPSFFDMFSFPFIQGSAATSLSNPMSIILTEAMARKYFGNEDPMNKSINIEGQAVLKVTGVIKNIPHNSHLQFDFIIPQKFVELSRVCGLQWGDFNFYTYLRLSPVRDVINVIEKVNAVATNNKVPQVIYGHFKFSLQGLSEIYLNPQGKFDLPMGNGRFVYIFSAIAFFILFIACVNFINLSTARSERRAREVGLRKVIGAQRTQIMRQFFGESLVLAALSLLIGLIFAYILLPVFNSLTLKALTIDLFNQNILLTILGVTALTGILAGLYPALFLSSFQPVEVLRSGQIPFRSLKRLSSKFFRQGVLRKGLVITQFTLSMVLILCTVVVYKQLDFAMKNSWQLQDDLILHIPAKENIGPEYETIKSELLEHRSITSVTIKDCLPIRSINNTTGVGWPGKTKEQENIHFETTRIGLDYFQTLDMDIVAGRGFSKEFTGDRNRAFILNEHAVKATGIEDPIGKPFRLYRNLGTIVGVVKDTVFSSIRSELRNQVYYLFPNYNRISSYGMVLIRVAGGKIREKTSSLPGVISHIEGVWNRVNSVAPFEYHFLDQSIEEQYKNEHRLAKLFTYCAILAIFISCLGLFGLASFMVEQKTKEIGVRKTMGAGTPDIIFLFSRGFMVLVLIAGILASPVAWYAMNRWLLNFAYRTTIPVWIFFVTLIIALAVAWITVSFQTIKSARSNPVDALRYE
ncbi:ABC transporter permease [Acidobacteriota bacterium]